MSKRNIKVFLFIFLVTVITLAICFFAFYVHTRKTVLPYGESTAENIAFSIANDTITDIIKDEEIKYNDIVILSKNSNGDISSLEIDIAKINILKSLISSRIMSGINKKEDLMLQIPFGTLIGNDYTLGMGPKINFRMKMSSSVYTDFESVFCQSGVNQVLHQIIIKIKITGGFVVPWYQSGFSTETSIIAAQTVLVGISPETFTYVYEGTGDGAAADAIFNYQAEKPN